MKELTNTIAGFVAVLSLSVSNAASGQENAEEVLGPAVDTSAAVEDLEPAVTTSTRSTTAPRTVDEIELDATAITGNQELPQVLYIVPWKSSDLGDLVGRPVNTLLDEVLAPADREVLKRQISYYEDLQPSEAEE
ncbi:MAG: hypothetical protein AAAFM81_10690 [Pseudomonadota bacterium]